MACGAGNPASHYKQTDPYREFAPAAWFERPRPEGPSWPPEPMAVAESEAAEGLECRLRPRGMHWISVSAMRLCGYHPHPPFFPPRIRI